MTTGLDALLRSYRRQAGLTQQEAADLAGMSVAALRDLEQGRVSAPRPATLRRLATALDLSGAAADELFRRSGQRSTPESLRLHVLGPLTVSVAGAPVDPGSARARAVLGLLALAPNAPVGRDALIEVAWDGAPPPKAVDLLQTHISRLRRRLTPADADAGTLLVATGTGYQLNVTSAELDLLAFRAAVTTARRARADGDLAAAFAGYQQAAALWRGEPLAGEPAFRYEPTAVALLREWHGVLLEHADIAEVLGRYEEVLPLLERLVAAEPLHEAAHARLILALAGTGQQAAALARFDEVRRRLADELGADPGAELTAAQLRVLRQEVTRRSTSPAAANRQLPPDLADFTGRAAELADLRDQLPPAGTNAATAITITAIEGMAGVGKTRLAVHLAHELVAAGRYADVQLYVDLRGHATEPPADPATVLASFLHLLGVPGGEIPVDVDARAALYRDRLHGQHALVLLDNAADEAQVRPLLPAGASNLVVVTSRRALALDGAHGVALDVFTPPEAEDLLVRIVGRRRVAAEPDAARTVVDLCGRLPIAVALAAHRLQSRPAWTLADLVRRLQESGDRLGELTAGNRALRAVFDLSYQALDTAVGRLFRLLGLHPGDAVTAESAAALAGTDPATARRLLDRLVDEHLLTMTAGDRYRMHDLVREYAGHATRTEDDDAERRAAVTRLLDYYLHATDLATRLVQPHQTGVELIGERPAHPLAVSTLAAAEQWLQSERATLTATLHMAADQGWPGHAWRLAQSLGHFLYLHGYPEDWGSVSQAGLRAAQAARDTDGEATIRGYLAWSYISQNRFEEAIEHLHHALELHQHSGDRVRQLTALANLSGVYYKVSRFADALEYAQQGIALSAGEDPFREAALRGNAGVLLSMLGRTEEALEMHRKGLECARRVDDPNYESGELANSGDAHRRLGHHEDARRYLAEALQVAVDAGLGPAESFARHLLGLAHRDAGRLDEALTELDEALRLVRTFGGSLSDHEVLVDLASVRRARGEDEAAERLLREALTLAGEGAERYQEARALTGLGELELKGGRVDAARENWERARKIFAACGTPEADEIGRRLDAIA